jgi:hypothetical protein
VFDVLTELECVIEKVAAEVADLDVERMCRLADRVDFLRLRAIGGFDRSLVWQPEGFLSAASAVRARTRMTRAGAPSDRVGPQGRAAPRGRGRVRGG